MHFEPDILDKMEFFVNQWDSDNLKFKPYDYIVGRGVKISFDVFLNNSKRDKIYHFLSFYDEDTTYCKDNTDYRIKDETVIDARINMIKFIISCFDKNRKLKAIQDI